MQANGVKQSGGAPPAMEALELVFDPVMRLAIRLTAVAKPRDPDAFERLLGEFAVAVIREAFEHQDEIRARLGMARSFTRETALPDDFIGGHETISTGAEADRPSAEQQTNPDTAAGVPPSAPSTSTPSAKKLWRLDEDTRRSIRERYAAAKRARPDASENALVRFVATELGVSVSSVRRFGPAAEPKEPSPHTTSERTESPRAALPNAAESIATTHAAGTPEAPRSPPVAEPASPPAEGATSRALSGDDDAGTSPAGPPPGAEESQAPSGLTDEDQDTLRREYLAAARDNGGSTPRGWVKQQASDYGVTSDEIFAAIAPAMRELAANGTQKREHEHAHSCWCRTKQASDKNPWCRIEKPKNAVPNLAGLQDRPSRSERYWRS